MTKFEPYVKFMDDTAPKGIKCALFSWRRDWFLLLGRIEEDDKIEFLFARKEKEMVTAQYEP